MCAPDPNAGRREAARVENNRRHAEFKANSIKQWNKEADFKQNLKTIRGMGRSRTQADFQELAVQAQGKALSEKESLARQYFQSKSVNEGGRSRGYGGAKNANYFAKVAKLDQQMFKLSTVGEGKFQEGLQRREQAMIKKQNDALGMGPQFGMPTMLPPKDRAGQLMNSISFGLNVASGIMAFSDKRLKDDVVKVGVSPKGYNIYEWTYRARPGETWRGVIAQDVVKQNPMAVGVLPSGFLGVYYDKLDVDLEAA